jgi:hypothetical protein
LLDEFLDFGYLLFHLYPPFSGRLYRSRPAFVPRVSCLIEADKNGKILEIAGYVKAREENNYLLGDRRLGDGGGIAFL